MVHSLWVISGLVLGFLTACAVGANDVANAMGTSVGSGILRYRQAVIIAAIFECLGAMLASGSVTHTIGQGIFDLNLLSAHPGLIVCGMFAALLSAFVWLVVATCLGWPVSTTHSIIGAMVGFAWVAVGWQHINWGIIGTIVGSWVVTPLISGVLAFVLFKVTYRLLYDTDQQKTLKWLMPVYMFFVVSLIVFPALRGCQHILGWQFSSCDIEYFGFFLVLLLTFLAVQWSRFSQKRGYEFEQQFGLLTVLTACSMAFAHGSNDVANAIGPLAVMMHVLKTGTLTHIGLPRGLVMLGSVGVMVGLATYGYQVMKTVGNRITTLTPSRSFAAQFATSLTVVMASLIGLPVSTTQTLVGAVMGVGLAGGIGAINMKVIRGIFLSWVVTVPAGIILSVVFYYMLSWIGVSL